MKQSAKKQLFTKSEICTDDPMVRRENFAVTLRNSKRKAIIAAKRLKLTKSKIQATTQVEVTAQQREEMIISVTQLFKEMAQQAKATGQQIEYTKLMQVKKSFSIEAEVEAFVQQVTTPVLVQFADAVYSLLKATLATQAESAVSACLQILINLTYDCGNISMSLLSCPGFRSLLLALIGDAKTCSDAVWLLIHVFQESEVELENLQKATIQELLAKVLQQGDLTLYLAVQAANLLVELGVIIGVEKLALIVQEKLLSHHLPSSESMEDSNDSFELEAADIDLAFGFLLNIINKGLLGQDLKVTLPLESFLIAPEGEIRQNCAKLMLKKRREVADINALLALQQSPQLSLKGHIIWCQLMGQCVSLETFSANRRQILTSLSQLLASRNATLVKNAVFALAMIQEKTGMPDFGLSAIDESQGSSVRCVYLRSLASAIQFNAEGDALQQNDTLRFSLTLAITAYRSAGWSRCELDQNLGDYILDIAENYLVFSHMTAVAEQASEIADLISSIE